MYLGALLYHGTRRARHRCESRDRSELSALARPPVPQLTCHDLPQVAHAVGERLQQHDAIERRLQPATVELYVMSE